MRIKNKVRPLPFSDEEEIWQYLNQLEEDKKFNLLPQKEKEEVEDYIRDVLEDYDHLNWKLKKKSEKSDGKIIICSKFKFFPNSQ